ncbi:hypothetical protein AADZ90_012750 [Aestuariibius sp. 2305UL40-4]|uniref:hypothetical protein n=1 Tax=Aestuariibius violaceus TaxID=3234132 RepID=UPI00345E31BC
MKKLLAGAAIAALVTPSLAPAGGLLAPAGEPEPLPPVVQSQPGTSAGNLGTIAAVAAGILVIAAIASSDDDDDDDDDDGSTGTPDTASQN